MLLPANIGRGRGNLSARITADSRHPTTRQVDSMQERAPKDIISFWKMQLHEVE